MHESEKIGNVEAEAEDVTLSYPPFFTGFSQKLFNFLFLKKNSFHASRYESCFLSTV